MDTQYFLEELYRELGGKILDESGYEAFKKAKGLAARGGFNPFPTHNRLFFIYNEIPLTVDFLSSKEMVIKVKQKPTINIRIETHTGFTKLLKKVHLYSYPTSGDFQVDEKYQIKLANQNLVHQIVTPEFIEIFTTLEPVYRFDLNTYLGSEYQVFKEVNLNEYTVSDAKQDIENLIKLYKLIIKNLEQQT